MMFRHAKAAPAFCPEADLWRADDNRGYRNPRVEVIVTGADRFQGIQFRPGKICQRGTAR